MGAITFSIDIKMVTFFQALLQSDLFIETGTFEGATVEQVLPLFPEIYSVELSQEYYEAAFQKFEAHPHVKLFLENSPETLKKVQSVFNHRNTIFWLDAHWCVAQNTAGQASQCPLLDELTAIQSLNEKSVIIIDDARLFLAAPPAPHEVSHWPTFDQIIKKLYKLSDKHAIAVLNDCILFYPHSIEAELQAFSHQHSVDWLYLAHQSRLYQQQEATGDN